MVIAGSNETILLFGGAVIIVLGLLMGFLLMRPNAEKTSAARGPVTQTSDTDRDPTIQPAPTTPTVTVLATTDGQEHLQRQSCSETFENEQNTREDQESVPIEPTPAMLGLAPQLKHRIVYRFMPHLKGMLFEGDTLDGYLADSVARATHRGWSDDELLAAARTGKWKKPRTSGESN
ncbi:MAG: hypothetical protein AAF709_01495 [Pseudomonadota bacterium]